MTAAHLQNYHAPENHNQRLQVLVRKFNIQLDKAKGRYSEIIEREDRGEKLCFADEAQCGNLYLVIQDLTRTIEALETLELPLEN
jgi:hypothetical protein